MGHHGRGTRRCGWTTGGRRRSDLRLVRDPDGDHRESAWEHGPRRARGDGTPRRLTQPVLRARIRNPVGERPRSRPVELLHHRLRRGGSSSFRARLRVVTVTTLGEVSERSRQRRDARARRHRARHHRGVGHRLPGRHGSAELLPRQLHVFIGRAGDRRRGCLSRLHRTRVGLLRAVRLHLRRHGARHRAPRARRHRIHPRRERRSGFVHGAKPTCPRVARGVVRRARLADVRTHPRTWRTGSWLHRCRAATGRVDARSGDHHRGTDDHDRGRAVHQRIPRRHPHHVARSVHRRRRSGADRLRAERAHLGARDPGVGGSGMAGRGSPPRDPGRTNHDRTTASGAVATAAGRGGIHSAVRPDAVGDRPNTESNHRR